MMNPKNPAADGVRMLRLGAETQHTDKRKNRGSGILLQVQLSKQEEVRNRAILVLLQLSGFSLKDFENSVNLYNDDR